MIRMVFSVNRELIHFIVIGKSIYYNDRKLGMFIRCLPKPEKLLEVYKNLERLFEFTQEELEEYSKNETEEAIAASVIRDAGLKSCRLILKKDIPTTELMLDTIKDKEVIILSELG
jgi:hypothetical protein